MINKLLAYKLLFLFFLLISGCSIIKTNKGTAVLKNVGPYLYYYEGIQNRLYGNVNTAIENLKESQKLNPNNDAVLYELALCYATLEQNIKAIEYLEEAISVNPLNKYYRTLVGILYLNENLLEKALTNQLELYSLDTTNIEVKFQLALIYSEIQKFEQALKLFSEIEDSYGFIPKISENRVKIYYELNDIDSAKDEIYKLTELDSNNPVYLLYKSDIQFGEGKDSLAFANIKRAIEINPNFPPSYFELYKRYLETSKSEKALNTLKTIFEKKQVNENEKVRLFYPILYEQNYYISYPQKLDSIIEIGLEKHPQSIPLIEMAYEHYLRRGNFKTARKSLEELKSLDTNNSVRWEKIISFDFSLQRNEMAMYNSIRAISLFPNNYIFYIYKALLLDEMNNINEAIETLKDGISNVDKNDDLSEMYGTLGDFYYKNNSIKSAFKAYSKAIKYNDQNARILNNYSYYLALRKQNLNSALEMSNKAVNLEPNNSTYIDTKGWVLFMMGRYEEAREVLRNAIAKGGSSSAIINEHYGDALYKTGNKDNAYIYWLKAKEIGGGSENLEEKILKKTYVP